jgi:hypothetical protein
VCLRSWKCVLTAVKVVCSRLGHASATETLETYSHLWPDNDENTVRVLDAAYDAYWSQSGHVKTP